MHGTRRHHLVLIALVAHAGGCLGGLANEPFTGLGSLQGQLGAAFVQDAAWVQLEGQPATLTGVDAQGRFRIDDLAAGEVLLIGSTGEGHALRQAATVVGGRAREVRLPAVAGARLDGQVQLQGDPQDRRAEVSLEGLPVSTKVDASGHYLLLGLPPTCYRLRATHPTHSSRSVEVCLSLGESRAIDLSLDSVGTAPGGLCSPCQLDSECQSGLCADHEHTELGERVCAQTCLDDSTCPPGFVCEEDEARPGRLLCLPREGSCSALQNVGAPCAGDAECGLVEGDGECVDQRCSVRCEADRDCPLGTTCSATTSDGESACR